jgi:hypothetical protein
MEGELGDLSDGVVNIRRFSKDFWGDEESDYLSACYRNGCIISVGATLIMARPVHTDAGWDTIRDYSVVFDDFNCWFIELAYGSIGTFVEHIPFDLPYVGYEHRNRLSLITLEKFKHYGQHKFKNPDAGTAEAPTTAHKD